MAASEYLKKNGLPDIRQTALLCNLRNFDAVDALAGTHYHHVAKYNGGSFGGLGLVKAQCVQHFTGSAVHKTDLAGGVDKGHICLALFGVEGHGGTPCVVLGGDFPYNFAGFPVDGQHRAVISGGNAGDNVNNQVLDICTFFANQRRGLDTAGNILYSDTFAVDLPNNLTSLGIQLIDVDAAFVSV